MDEICKVFNLPEEVVRKYVQFGEVFNLLHAAASYLRVHQKGFGAVGVSKKYVFFQSNHCHISSDSGLFREFYSRALLYREYIRPLELMKPVYFNLSSL